MSTKTYWHNTLKENVLDRHILQDGIKREPDGAVYLFDTLENAQRDAWLHTLSKSEVWAFIPVKLEESKVESYENHMTILFNSLQYIYHDDIPSDCLECPNGLKNIPCFGFKKTIWEHGEMPVSELKKIRQASREAGLRY